MRAEHYVNGTQRNCLLCTPTVFRQNDNLGLYVRKSDFVVCEQQRCRPGCICAQSDHHSLQSAISKLASGKISRF